MALKTSLWGHLGGVWGHKNTQTFYIYVLNTKVRSGFIDIGPEFSEVLFYIYNDKNQL